MKKKNLEILKQICNNKVTKKNNILMEKEIIFKNEGI